MTGRPQKVAQKSHGQLLSDATHHHRGHVSSPACPTPRHPHGLRCRFHHLSSALCAPGKCDCRLSRFVQWASLARSRCNCLWPPCRSKVEGLTCGSEAFNRRPYKPVSEQNLYSTVSSLPLGSRAARSPVRKTDGRLRMQACRLRKAAGNLGLKVGRLRVGRRRQDRPDHRTREQEALHLSWSFEALKASDVWRHVGLLATNHWNSLQ